MRISLFMPQLRNAEKALRQSVKRQVRNTNVKSNISFLVKSSKKQAMEKSDKTMESVKAAIKAIDKASQKGILKRNTAARQKSRLMATIKKLQAKVK